MSASQYTTLRTAYFPFDIGKNVHWFAAYAGPTLQPLVAPQAVRANQAGFEQAAAALSELLASDQFDQLVMGHEPTGIYHEAWARALFARFAEPLRATPPRLIYRFVNPYQTKQARQRKLGRNRKTDALREACPPLPVAWSKAQAPPPISRTRPLCPSPNGPPPGGRSPASSAT